MRRQKNKSQIHLPEGEGHGVFMDEDWIEGCQRWEWTKAGKRWSNCFSEKAYLHYMFRHVRKMVSLAWPEGGVFGPLMSKCYLLDKKSTLCWLWLATLQFSNSSPGAFLIPLCCLFFPKHAPCSNTLNTFSYLLYLYYFSHIKYDS